MKWFNKNNNVRNAERPPACNGAEERMGPLETANKLSMLLEAWKFF